MEDSKSKIEAIKPVIIKAGIPLAVSVGCLLWAKFISARSVIPDYPTPKDQEDDDDQDQFRSITHLLMEFGNLLKMEMVRVEVLSRRVSSMEVENQKVENMVMEYVKVLEEMELCKLETQVIKRKVKKLFRIVRQQSSSIRRTKRRLETQEMEVSIDRGDREDEKSVVRKLEDDVRELRQSLEQMQLEKNEILVKLNSAEASKQTNYEEASAMEEYSRMLKELQQLQKEQAAEEEELDACLRHKLLIRSHHHIIEEEDQEQTTSAVDPNSLQLAVIAEQNGVISKRKKLLQKLRKWVEGSDHGKVKVKHTEINEHNNNNNVHARRSCSSA